VLIMNLVVVKDCPAYYLIEFVLSFSDVLEYMSDSRHLFLCPAV